MFSLRFLILTFAVLSSSLYAEEKPNSPKHGPRPERIGISNTEGKGLGYSQGYTSLDLFLSQPFCEKRCVPFLDLRGHIFTNGKYAANAGAGFRWMNKKCTQVLGINGFYDYRLTKHRPYNQVAMGLEFLANSWGVTVNGYLPVGRKETPLYEFEYLAAGPTFFLMKGREQFALKGADAEVGYRYCNNRGLIFNAGIGPYFYWGRSAATESALVPAHRHAFGGRLTAGFSWRNLFALEGAATYDSLYKWGGQGTVTLSIPFDFTFKTKGVGCTNCMQQRLYQPVRRNEIIVTDRIHRYSEDPDILDPEKKP